MKKTGLMFVLFFLFISVAAYPHCQIPCGIYDDDMRFSMIEEHITTIEKSMTMIKELSSEDIIDYNQVARWVENKEHHCGEIDDIVTNYFMAQRIKPLDSSNPEGDILYNDKIRLLHELLFNSMKSKQTIDISYPGKMRILLDSFRGIYFKK